MQRDLAQPPDKIVKNLCTFLCQDIEQTPTFAFNRKVLGGVLSFSTGDTPVTTSNGKDGTDKNVPTPEAAAKARLSRRGAKLAFEKLSAKFGPKLLDTIPKMWQSMAGGLLNVCAAGNVPYTWSPMANADCCIDSVSKMDSLIEKQYGQDVIDSFSVLEAVVPTFHEELSHNFTTLFPKVALALRSRYAIVRQSAARSFATICGALTADAMRYVIENVVPYLGDAASLANRQGAIELIYRK